MFVNTVLKRAFLFRMSWCPFLVLVGVAVAIAVPPSDSPYLHFHSHFVRLSPFLFYLFCFGCIITFILIFSFYLFDFYRLVGFFFVLLFGLDVVGVFMFRHCVFFLYVVPP